MLVFPFMRNECSIIVWYGRKLASDHVVQFITMRPWGFLQAPGRASVYLSSNIERSGLRWGCIRSRPAPCLWKHLILKHLKYFPFSSCPMVEELPCRYKRRKHLFRATNCSEEEYDAQARAATSLKWMEELDDLSYFCFHIITAHYRFQTLCYTIRSQMGCWVQNEGRVDGWH